MIIAVIIIGFPPRGTCWIFRITFTREKVPEGRRALREAKRMHAVYTLRDALLNAALASTGHYSYFDQSPKLPNGQKRCRCV